MEYIIIVFLLNTFVNNVETVIEEPIAIERESITEINLAPIKNNS